MARNSSSQDILGFEVLKHALASVTDEMMLTLQRTGYSPTTTQAFDFSVALCDPRGRLLMQGLAVAGHMGSIPFAVRAVQGKFGDSIGSGDIFLLNDPYEGGMHLPDIFVIQPVFIRRRLFAFACAVVHHTDVGGRSPGSMAHDSTEIYQEGLRLPPIRLYRDGNLNETLLDIISRNVRIPDKVIGDLRAEMAACAVGVRRLLELANDYGSRELSRLFEQLMDYSERIARGIIAKWPDGRYEFVDFIDDDGLDPDPIRLSVAVTIEGDSITVDYDGTSEQVRGAFNCTRSWTEAWTNSAIRCALGVDIPNNDGCFRPVRIIIPEGSILNMRHPAACAARGMTGHRLPDLIFGALSQAIPDQIPAAAQGGTSTLRAGTYSAAGRAKVFYDNVYGVRGATPISDAQEGVAELGGNLSNVSVEVLELAFPLRVRRYAVVPDSEGAGKYRGSLAIIREWEVLAPSMNVTLRSDRRKFPPYGLNGGASGSPSNTVLNPDGESRTLPSKINMALQRGDVLLHRCPSGGGWGDPRERDATLVLQDWRLGKVTAARALETYGVVIDEEAGRVDKVSTTMRRRHLSTQAGDRQ